MDIQREQVHRLPIALVYPNPEQPRKFFAPRDIEELAASIVKHGLLQPITVVPRHTAKGDYLIVSGERRWRASLEAKLTEIKAIVRQDLSDRQVAELALVENLLRQDLSIVEEARAYAGFLSRGYSLDSLAEVLGMQQPWRIRERLNLLKLADPLLDGVAKGAISASQAQEMSRLSHEGQYTLWRAIQAGSCPTYTALRRTASALLDCEKQVELFRTRLSKKDLAVASQVDRVLKSASRLLGQIKPEMFTLLREVRKSNARVAAAELDVLEKLCREMKNALLENAAKQEIAG